MKSQIGLRVLTLNIHKGISLARRTYILEQIRKGIRESKADLVCLQEVVGNSRGPISNSQFEFLADEVWSHYAYGKNAISTNGHHGNAILSLYPFKTYENIDISNHLLERRGLLHGILELPGQNLPLHILTLHLDLSSWGRRRQLRKICEHIELNIKPDEPALICGDFNDWREEATHYVSRIPGFSEAHAQLNGQYAKTYPAFFPFLKLDRIYIRGFNIVHAECLNSPTWKRLSDHLPLVADLITSN